MFISKSMRIFALTILLVPVAQPAMALSPRMSNVIAEGVARTALTAIYAGLCSAVIRTFCYNASSFSKIDGYAAALGGVFSGLIAYLEYKGASVEEAEYRAQRKEEKARKDYRIAAAHAAGYARICNDQSAQKAAKAAQDARSYNSSLESSRAQRLLS